MEHLAPPHRLALYLRHQMLMGNSISSALKTFLLHNPDEWTGTLLQWKFLMEGDQETSTLRFQQSSIYRRQLLGIMERAWRGEPVIAVLSEFISEVEQASRRELEVYVAKVPFQLAVPMLTLQLPAYLLVMLGPLFLKLLEEFKL